jgi:cytochrome P450
MHSPSSLPRFPFDTPPHLDYEPEHARLRAEGPLARVRLDDGSVVWIACRRDAVRTVLSDQRFSRAEASRPGAPSLTPGITSQPDAMINMDPPQHTRLRRLVASTFTARMVEQRRPRIREIVESLLDAMSEQGPPADLVAELAFPLPITILCDLLGMPYEDAAQVRRWSEVSQSVDAYPLEQVMAAFAAIAAHVERLIDRKRRNPGDDLLTRLIEAGEDDDRLTHRELVMMAEGLLVAGHETTASQIPVSLLTLFHHPDQLDLLRRRPELVPTAVEELLRYGRLLTAAFGRTATTDVEVEGVTLPAGDTVFALLSSANRDEGAHPEPDRLDVTRQGPPHLAFGMGPHLCIGAPLARVELQEALAGILRRFPRLRLAVPESELVWKVGNFIRGVRTLPVTW